LAGLARGLSLDESRALLRIERVAIRRRENAMGARGAALSDSRGREVL